MDMSRTIAFGDLLRRHRLAAGLSQEALAERSGLSVRGISSLERGERREPRFETVRMLADALELPAEACAELLRVARPASGVMRDEQPVCVSLPVPPTAMVGRASEANAIAALAAGAEARLITLTGPGGVGKTRLALEVAHRVATAFPDGARFADMAPIADRAGVVPAIASSLGVRETAGTALQDALRDFLADRQTLLVLDNFEHVLAAAPVVSWLLARCSGLTVLVTSRVPLHLRGERLVPIPPLGVPDGAALSPEQLDAFEAVRLFVARSRDVKPDFLVREGDVTSVATICRRLDGLPLALELAAARTRVLSLSMLATRLEHRLTLLTAGATDLPDRHRTLRAAIAWSDDLLQPEERRFFRSLAVFAGGWTLEAAEAVAGEPAEVDTLEALSTLVDASLVQAHPGPGGTSRFSMLETVREFALEQLEQDGETENARRRHALHCLGVSESLRPQIETPEGRQVLEILETEHPNLRAALSWTIHRGEAGVALRLAGALWKFWYVRGHFDEGRRWLEQALRLQGELDPGIRSEVLYGAGCFARDQGDEDRALAWGQACLALSDAAGDTLRIAMAQFLLGTVASRQGSLDLARARYEAALTGFQDLGHTHGTAMMLLCLGRVASELNDSPRAAPLFEEALGIWQARGDRWGIAHAKLGLAEAATAMGEPVRAGELLAQAISHYADLGDTARLAACLEVAARVMLLHRRPVQAARVLGAAEEMRIAAGVALGSRELPRHAMTIDDARTAIDHEAYSAAWSAGRTLSADDAVAEALDGIAAAAGVDSGGGSRELTRRERDVLRLIAEGWSDAEIAEALFLAPRTVSWHVSHILTKLDVASRTAAAAVAIRGGLIRDPQ